MPARPGPAVVLASFLLAPLPLAAQNPYAPPWMETVSPFSHAFEARFGVAYTRDSNGQSRTESLAMARYTLRFDHQFDNGMRFGVQIGLDAGNYPYRLTQDRRPFTR